MGFPISLFVEKPPAALLCGICHDVLVAATTACQEGHAFCKACLAPTSVTKCPTCRGALIKTNCLPIQNIINGLEVKCPNKEDSNNNTDTSTETEENNSNNSKPPPSKKRRKSAAKHNNATTGATATAASASDTCNWVGKLADLPKHQSDVCKFTPIDCEHDGCTEKVLRRHAKKHASQCSFRPSRCNKCKQIVPHRKLPNHDCPKEMTTCPYCNKRMLREELLGAGAPNYYKDENAGFLNNNSNGSSLIRMPDSMNNNSGTCTIATTRTTTDATSTTSTAAVISPASGREAFQDILNEKTTFIPTDAECEGHYKVCQNVPLRCEFHKQGCLIPLTRKDLAEHHATKGQYHAALVSKAFDEIPAAVEEKLQKEHITLVFEVPSYNLRGHKNCVSSSSTVAGYTLRLKLYLHRDDDEPISVAIRCTEAPTHETISISNIQIRILKSRDDNNNAAASQSNNGFYCSGSQKLERRNGEYTEAVEFSTPIAYKEENNKDSCFMNGSHIVKLAETNNKVFIHASFSIPKRKVRNLGGVFSTTSPSPSPSRDYGDY